MLESWKITVANKTRTFSIGESFPNHLEIYQNSIQTYLFREHPQPYSKYRLLDDLELNPLNSTPTKSFPTAVAANETGRIWGDPHFEGGDGGKFDLQGEDGKSYHLLSDTGLSLNGKFVSSGNNKTVVGETGLNLSGPSGTTKIHIQTKPQAKVTINGRQMQPGESVPTADGGTATLSSDGKKLTVKTKEGYTIEQMVKKEGEKGEMEIQVQTPRRGVASDRRMPAGLLGQTFDRDQWKRNGKGNQGQGAIKGNYQDYEVGGGLFGDPSPKVSSHATNVFGTYQFFQELGLKSNGDLRFPASNPVSMESINWQEEVRQSTLDSMLAESTRKAKEQVLSNNSQTNRLTHLLMLALQSGNMSLAMMLYSHIEAREANELTKNLVLKIRDQQEKKRQLSQQMMNQKNDADGVKQTQLIKTEVESINDDISVLQTFIKEVAQNKQQALEMANGFLTIEHQTAMAIVRSLGR